MFCFLCLYIYLSNKHDFDLDFNFFHCKANYEAAKRGNWGAGVGKAISTGREIYGLVTRDPLSDIRKDWNANQMGWNGAKQGLSLKDACPTDPKAYFNPEYYK